MARGKMSQGKSLQVNSASGSGRSYGARVGWLAPAGCGLANWGANKGAPAKGAP